MSPPKVILLEIGGDWNWIQADRAILSKSYSLSYTSVTRVSTVCGDQKDVKDLQDYTGAKGNYERRKFLQENPIIPQSRGWPDANSCMKGLEHGKWHILTLWFYF